MSDRDWLDKVDLAARHYETVYKEKTEDVRAFVNWIYFAYGYVPPVHTTVPTEDQE
jgi:hypothetical protein